MIHPKKGSPSGRNAYPVTEKIEEFKKEKKNDMAKKKTFQEYTQEALLEIEKIYGSIASSGSFNGSVPGTTNRPFLIISVVVPSARTTVIAPNSSYGIVISV